MRRSLALLLAPASLLLSQDKAPPIRFPVVPVIPQPMPPPPAPPPPARLAADMLYVIDSDIPLLVFASPDGSVTIQKEPGPLRIKGKFVGGLGKIETKDFKGKWVVTVQAASVGQTELIIVPEGAKTEADGIRKLLDVDDGTKPNPPNPDPKPDPRPDPKPDPQPDNSPTKLFLVVVDETATQAESFRGKYLFDPTLAARCQEKGHIWRVVDKDVVGVDGKPPQDVARFISAAAGKGYPVYFLVDPTGKVRATGRVPEKPADFLDIIKKVGG